MPAADPIAWIHAALPFYAGGLLWLFTALPVSLYLAGRARLPERAIMGIIRLNFGIALVLLGNGARMLLAGLVQEKGPQVGAMAALFAVAFTLSAMVFHYILDLR